VSLFARVDVEVVASRPVHGMGGTWRAMAVLEALSFKGSILRALVRFSFGDIRLALVEAEESRRPRRMQILTMAYWRGSEGEFEPMFDVDELHCEYKLVDSVP
jgi:hypothetical protein